MSKIAFKHFNFRDDTLQTIAQANAIIGAYQAQGYRLTVRQLYYQFVARDLIENSQRSYKRLVGIIGDGRLAGLIDWNAIEDRTRNLSQNSHWTTPASIISSAAWGFAIDKWADQPVYVEVWIEKQALAGVIARICSRLDVPFMACKGYMSLSEMFDAGLRMAQHIDDGQKVYILHLGDHDPSGIDMTRDITDRARMFAEHIVGVDRLALNFDQIELYSPPPNFAKLSDSRYGAYVVEYGRDSWELDALEPEVLNDLIETAVLDLRDEEAWRASVEREDEMKAQLQGAAKHWDKVADFVTSLNGE